MKGLVLYSVFLALLPLKSFATSGVTIGKEIASFNSGNFSEAAQFGKELVLLNPRDFKARYYYASALMKLNRIEEAHVQYAECYRTTNDPTMKSYCYQALQAAGTVTSPPKVDSSSVERSDFAVTSVTSNDSALAARKLQIMTDGAKEIEFHRRQAQANIQKAKERANEQMDGIPPYFERPLSIISAGSLRTEMTHIENPDYKPAFERSQIDLANAISVINKDLARRDAEITAECLKKVELYDQVPNSLRSQQKPGISQIQMTPQNSSGYLRNFVNYDGSAPVSLKAKQGALRLGTKNASNQSAQNRP